MDPPFNFEAEFYDLEFACGTPSSIGGGGGGSGSEGSDSEGSDGEFDRQCENAHLSGVMLVDYFGVDIASEKGNLAACGEIYRLCDTKAGFAQGLEELDVRGCVLHPRFLDNLEFILASPSRRLGTLFTTCDRGGIAYRFLNTPNYCKFILVDENNAATLLYTQSEWEEQQSDLGEIAGSGELSMGCHRRQPRPRKPAPDPVAYQKLVITNECMIGWVHASSKSGERIRGATHRAVDVAREIELSRETLETICFDGVEFDFMTREVSGQVKQCVGLLEVHVRGCKTFNASELVQVIAHLPKLTVVRMQNLPLLSNATAVNMVDFFFMNVGCRIPLDKKKRVRLDFSGCTLVGDGTVDAISRSIYRHVLAEQDVLDKKARRMGKKVVAVPLVVVQELNMAHTDFKCAGDATANAIMVLVRYGAQKLNLNATGFVATENLIERMCTYFAHLKKPARGELVLKELVLKELVLPARLLQPGVSTAKGHKVEGSMGNLLELLGGAVKFDPPEVVSATERKIRDYDVV